MWLYNNGGICFEIYQVAVLALEIKTDSTLVLYFKLLEQF